MSWYAPVSGARWRLNGLPSDMSTALMGSVDQRHGNIIQENTHLNKENEQKRGDLFTGMSGILQAYL